MENIFTNFDGLYSQNYPNLAPDYLFSELIETRSSLFNWKIKTHIHTKLYQLFFIREGEGTCFLSEQNFTLNAKSVLIIPPNYVHGFEWSPNVSGHILTLSSIFIDNLLKQSPNVILDFSKPLAISNFEDRVNFQVLIDLIEEINMDLNNNHSERFQMLKFKIGILLLRIYRIQIKDISSVPTDNNEILGIFNSFQKNIRKSGYNKKSIIEYANDLNITNNRLNKVCKMITGRTAIWVINDVLASEIKQRLIHTTKTISDICYDLEFNDPSYFTRFFKKHVGISPKEFRRSSLG